MNRTAVHEACQALSLAIAEVEARLFDLPEGEERSRYLRAMQRMAHLLETELQGPLSQASSAPHHTDVPGSTAERNSVEDPLSALCNALGAATLEEIDAWLLEACTPQWRQAARVTGTAVGQWPELPIALFAERLQTLARAGHIEAKGDLAMVLQSEVRRLG